MARVSLNTSESILKINKFLGLNETYDGDNSLKAGEFVDMRNFKITRDGHLKLREGTRRMINTEDYVVTVPSGHMGYHGSFHGYVNNREVTLIAQDGNIFEVDFEEHLPLQPATLYRRGTYRGEYICFVPFGTRIYAIDGEEMKVWDRSAGASFTAISPYIPLIQTATTPSGAGTLLETLNRLTNKRRVKFSPDGTSKGFTLPEKNISAVDRVTVDTGSVLEVESVYDPNYDIQVDGSLFVEQLQTLEITSPITVIITEDGQDTVRVKNADTLAYIATGVTRSALEFIWGVTGVPEQLQLMHTRIAVDWVSEGDEPTYTVDLENGVIHFETTPLAGTNTITVTYAKGRATAHEVISNRAFEIYNGATDSRVFLYGNGTNRLLYSGINGDTGLADATYFPVTYELEIGDANTPVTGAIRHYSRLMVYKPGSAWSVAYGTQTLADGSIIPAFTVQTVNRQTGNDRLGIVTLLENNPVTISGGELYKWSSNSNYASYITYTENNARRISDNVKDTLAGMTGKGRTVRTVNVQGRSELWIIDAGGELRHPALIYNYGNGTWYKYANLPFSDLCEVGGKIYGFGVLGVFAFEHETKGDFSASGLIPIDAYAETGSIDMGKEWIYKVSSGVFIAAIPEKDARFEVSVKSGKDFEGNSEEIQCDKYGVSEYPRVFRTRLKVRHAPFYKLFFKSNRTGASATVLEADIKYRSIGTVRR